jgi:organic hydroperoxide reductase OsmC/OhrA
MTQQADRFALTLTLQQGYEFTVDFAQHGVPDLEMDEPPPLGVGHGPNATRLLGAAIGNCLSASLLFCLHRAKIDVQGLRTVVEGTLVRNEQGRMRIGEIRVKLAPDVTHEQRERMGRCLELFEDFCIVTESVRQGVKVEVEVEPATVAAALP